MPLRIFFEKLPRVEFKNFSERHVNDVGSVINGVINGIEHHVPEFEPASSAIPCLAENIERHELNVPCDARDANPVVTFGANNSGYMGTMFIRNWIGYIVGKIPTVIIILITIVIVIIAIIENFIFVDPDIFC